MTTGVKKVQIEGCQTANGNGFKVIGESKEIANKNGGVQNESVRIQSPTPQIMIKLVIAEGWEDFSSVHHISF